MKTSVGRFAVKTSAGTWVESHGALGAGFPGFRIAPTIRSDISNVGINHDLYVGGLATSIRSSGNGFNNDQNNPSRFLGGSSRESRFQSSSFDAAGGGPVVKVSGGVAWINPISVSGNNVLVDDASGVNNFTTSCPYFVSYWDTTSVQAEPTLSNTIISTNVGSLYTSSTAITAPDIAFVMGQMSEPTLPNDAVQGFNQTVWGFVDCNLLSSRFVHEGATTNGFYGVGTSKNIVIAGENGDRGAIAISSMASHGLVFEVLSRDAVGAGGVVWDTHGLAVTYVKLPPDTGAHVGNMVTSLGTHTFSQQTNSVYPTWAMFIGTNVRSYDEGIPGENSSVDLAATGFWSTSGNAGGLSASFYGETISISSVSNRIVEARVNTVGIDYFSDSLSTGSGAFSMSFTCSQGHGHNIVNYLVIGDSINAPSHLMDANSKSIFLADDSDYNDNLLLVGGGVEFPIGSCYYAVMSNPGYEEGNLNGWTVIGNTTASSFASLTGKEGNYFAIAGTSGQTAIWYQDYDIPNSFGVSSGNLMVSLSALFSDAAASGEDHGHMQIAFLNSSSQLMAATATKTDSSGFRGLTNTADSTDMVPVPPGTTKVRVGFSAGDGTGDTQLSFYVDTTTMVFCVGSKWYRQVTPNNGHFADLAITAWTQKTGTTLAFSGGVIQSDWRANGIVPSYTYGSGLNSAEIAQGVDIASYGNLYQQIDTGSAYFELRYFLSGVTADGGRVGVRFMNAGSTVLGSYSLTSTTAFPTIITSVICATTTIPASTRIIGYHIHHDTGGAGNIDYYPTALNGVVVVNFFHV